ncbi:hypothetical protein ACP70R_050157 [Stipagrostis hirtigluma subsp. patula]
MREAFNVFDQNGDGFITMDELRTMLVALGIRQGQGAATLDDCGRMVGQVDRNDEGRVDFSEFKQMMRSRHLNQKAIGDAAAAPILDG